MPQYSPDQPLTDSQAVFIFSTVAGAWQMKGQPYTSGVPVALTPGWNVAGIPFPIESMSAGAIAAQVAKQGGTVSEIAMLVDGKYEAWTPKMADVTIPPGTGVWILYSGPTTMWTPS